MSTTIESLELEILSSSQSAESGLDKLTASLEKLKTATKGGVGLTAVANQLQKVSSAVNSISPSSVSNVTGLAKAIELLGGTKISSTIATQITAMSNALNGADFTGSNEKLRSLAESLAPLSNLPKTNLSSYVNNLKKLPEALNALDDSTISALTDKIQKLATALKPLGDEMQKVANGFSAFPNKIQKLISTTNSLSSANNRASKSYIDLWAKLKMGATAVKDMASKFASFLQTSMGYHETVNLFSVSMGKYADEAARYAEQVSEVMGIDPAEWMKYQGTIMTLATGFGVAGDRANVMSQQLTQLAYDISSFRDISIETAMQKIQSGFAGELEPLRAIGYDLSQAKLSAIAASLGIDKAVTSMTQAEKAQLRYYAIMTQVIDSHQDMGKTLESPANQMRILKAQITQAARAIGNVFIPVLNNLLPWIIAITKVVRILADTIASLFDVELPEVEFSGVDDLASGAEDASGALDDAADSAKKLKSHMLGFDELNVINPNEGQDSAIDDTLGQFDFELPTYNFMEKVTESRINDIVEDMKEWLGITEEITSWSEFFDTNLGQILLTVGAIGAGFGAWKVAEGLLAAIEAIKGLKSGNIMWSFGVIGAIAFIADLQKLKEFVEDFAENGASFSNVSGIISEFAGLVGDAMIVLGNVKVGGALKVIQGVGEIVSAISDISANGVDIENAMDVVRGISNIGIGIGVMTGNLTLTGVSLTLQGLTGVITELAENWDAIKNGDWSGVDKATLVIGAVEIIGGIATAIIGIQKIKGIEKMSKASKTVEEVTTATTKVSETTSTLSPKLTSFAKNLGMGLVILAEVAGAAILFTGAIWVLGKELEQVGIAWQPVLDNGETIATAIGIGTGILVAIGAITAGLGSIGTTLIVNIALGTGVLAEVGVAAGLFLAEIWAVGKLLDEIGKAWQPVLDNGETIATAIEIGTGILLAVGIVTAALGALALATGATVYVAIAAGTGMLLEIGGAAVAFLKELEIVGDALMDIYDEWKPVLDNGEDIEQAIDTGTSLLTAIGVVAAALGVARVASFGAIDLAIDAGTGMLKKLAKAFGDFCDNLSDVSDDITDTLAPALEKVNVVLPSVKDDMGDFVRFMTAFAGDMVIYAGSSAIAGIAATIDKFIKFFTTDPVEHLADEIDGQYGDLVTLKDDFKGMKTVLPEVQDGMDDYVGFMASFAGDMVAYTVSSAISGIAATINKFLGFFTTDPMKRMADEVNEQYGYAKTLKSNLKKAIPEIRDATDMLDDYDDAIGDFEEASGTSFGTNSVKKFFIDLAVSVTDKATGVWNNIKTTFGNVGSWFETNVASPVKTKFSDMWANAPTKAEEAWSGIKKKFDFAGKWFETNVGTPIGNSLKNGWKKVTDAFSDGGNIFTDIKDGVLTGFKSVVNKLISGINKVIKVPFEGINTALTKIKNIEIFGYEPFSGIGTISIPQIPTLADGGIVNSGQLFIAREAGPELVSNIGGRTAVMNNDQIVESVSTGVYQAVVAALGSGSDEGGETQIVINLDGEKIYENQQKVARNRGYNLGMGAFSFG